MKFLPWIAIALIATARAAGDGPAFCRFQPPADGTAPPIATGGRAFVDCPPPLSMPSGPFALEASGGVIGFRKSADDSATAAATRIPAGVKTALILVLPVTGKGPQPFEAVAIDDSAKGFSKDGCAVLDLYQADVRFSEGQRHLFATFIDSRTKRPRLRSFGMGP